MILTRNKPFSFMDKGISKAKTYLPGIWDAGELGAAGTGAEAGLAGATTGLAPGTRSAAVGGDAGCERSKTLPSETGAVRRLPK